MLPPLPGGMKPGDLKKFILPQVAERLPVPLFLSNLMPPTGVRGIRLRDKPKRFNHRNDNDVNPFVYAL